VNIRDINARLKPDQYHFAMRHGYDVRLTWKTPSELLIEYPNKAAVDIQQEQVKGVVVAGTIVRVKYSAVETVPVNSIDGGSKCSGS
jgi:hypothetical protein